jgi:hypothetical protein
MRESHRGDLRFTSDPNGYEEDAKDDGRDVEIPNGASLSN